MKKSISFALLFLISSSVVKAQSFGLGFQANFPSYGLSAKYDLNQVHSAQFIYGAFGTLEAISGRYLYNFSPRRNDVKPFLYAQAGIWTYSMDLSPLGGVDISESVLGYGFGAGIEIPWLAFISEDLKWTLELGIGIVNLDIYEVKATSFGSGIHYYF